MTSSHQVAIPPGPKAIAYLERDPAAFSPCYGRPYPFVMGDVPVKRLMIGVELVKDKGSKERAETLRETLLLRAFERGLLLLGCGPSTVRFMPALNVPRELVDEALIVFECALADLEEEMGLRLGA